MKKQSIVRIAGGGNFYGLESDCRGRGLAIGSKVPRAVSTGFTLAEVLITLGIIGVVAALTIPGLMTAYKAHRYRSQFLKSYSIVQQAFRQMEADDVSTDPNSYGLDSYYKTFSHYVKFLADCGTNAKGMKSYPQCYTKTSPKAYKAYDGKTKAYTEVFDDGQLVLIDGTNLLFENPSNTRIFVHVDLNGFLNPPNRWGYDLFTFHFIDGELRTMGSRGTAYSAETYCNPKSTSNYNGIGCAHYAKNNTDYFKKIIKSLK